MSYLQHHIKYYNLHREKKKKTTTKRTVKPLANKVGKNLWFYIIYSHRFFYY